MKRSLINKYTELDSKLYTEVQPLDKDDFVSYFSSNANSTQLKSLIMCFKYGVLGKSTSSGMTVQLLRSKGAGSHAAVLKKTIEHYNIKVSELIEALQAAKDIIDNK